MSLPTRKPSSSSTSTPRRDSRSLPPALKSPFLYYNPEIPDSQGLGVDGRSAGESGWAEPLIPATPISPIASINPTLTRFQSIEQQQNQNQNQNQVKHKAIPNSWAFLNSQPAAPQQTSSTKKSKLKKLKSLLGFSNDQDLLNHMDVTLDEIIRGRICRPLSLNDLRTYLRNQRLSALNSSFSVSGPELDLSMLGGVLDSSNKNVTIASPPSASLCSNLTVSMSMNDSHPEVCEKYIPTLDQEKEKTLVSISETVENNFNSINFSSNTNANINMNEGAISPTNGDELDALQFLASFERYRRKFSNLTRNEKKKSPRIGSNGEILDLKSTHSRSESSAEISNLNVNGIDVDSSSLPLRRELDRIYSIYLSPSTSTSTSSSHVKNNNRQTTQPSTATATATTTTTTTNTRRRRRSSKRRLQWLIDLGLLSEELVSTSISRSEQTTHPSLLEPIYDVVYNHLSIHVLPNFLLSSTRNLSTPTRRGRLSIGISSLILAILFTILLLLRPSPLSISGDHQSNVIRWYRILTFPLWSIGFGYCIAAKTGVCVWLTLRGNREPEKDGVRWENHSVDGDREIVGGGISKGNKNDDDDEEEDDEGLNGCKPCQRSNKCWGNENEKEEIEIESDTLINQSTDSSSSSSSTSNSNSSNNKTSEKEVLKNDEEDRIGRTTSENENGNGNAWLAPELLDLLSKFGLAPKFLYGRNLNQCGLNHPCSSSSSSSNQVETSKVQTHQIEENENQNRFSSFSDFSNQSNSNSISILTPLPLVYNSSSNKKVKDFNNEKIMTMSNENKNVLSSTQNLSQVQTKATSTVITSSSSSSPQHSNLTIKNLDLVSSSYKKGNDTKFLKKCWISTKRWIGLAVSTEKVKESKVRKIQQRIALKALISCMVYSVIVVIIITAVP